jgi:cystathionine beta-synthase
VFAKPEIVDNPVATVMDPPLATIGTGEPVDMAVARLEASPAVVVLDAGHPIGIVTRYDLLGFVTGTER